MNPFTHPALFYRTDREYLSALVPFAEEGLDAGQPVAMAVPGARLDLVRSGLGTLARHVTLLDMAVEGRNPGRIIARVLRRFADRHRDRHVRIVGEPIWAGRSEVEYPACAQHEALINLAFDGRDVTILCPYDLSTLSPVAVADALVTHPVVWEGTSSYPSSDYDVPGLLSRYNEPLPEPPADAVFEVSGTGDLGEARKFAAERADGVGRERVADVELIVTELATNSLRHSGGSCRVGVWRADGHLVCDVRDGGRLSDPLAGRRPPEPGQLSGRGLLMVNDLADLVRLHSGPTGTTVRALLRLA
ncbi:anti-sigma factor RsbA family regulatory protein [Saccharothrix sp.]|uniref:anti-sigma factor RsbA family regulatory protein n=1 Tax=Saccharothrix sp. TaxID=1873460 RepID=UPI002812825C|nr:anti-sigma factor RsbA family regulatory protein [Saccharothrix sp.]